jgi:hypothetical protein
MPVRRIHWVIEYHQLKNERKLKIKQRMIRKWNRKISFKVFIKSIVEIQMKVMIHLHR